MADAKEEVKYVPPINHSLAEPFEQFTGDRPIFDGEDPRSFVKEYERYCDVNDWPVETWTKEVRRHCDPSV